MMDHQLAIVIAPTCREARRVGATRYQGRPCRRGHPGVRFTENGSCVDCDQ